MIITTGEKRHAVYVLYLLIAGQMSLYGFFLRVGEGHALCLVLFGFFSFAFDCTYVML